MNINFIQMSVNSYRLGFVPLNTLYLRKEWPILMRLWGAREWGISTALHPKQGIQGSLPYIPECSINWQIRKEDTISKSLKVRRTLLTLWKDFLIPPINCWDCPIALSIWTFPFLCPLKLFRWWWWPEGPWGWQCTRSRQGSPGSVSMGSVLKQF